MVRYRRTDEFVRFCLNSYSSSAVEVDPRTLSGVYGSGAKFSGSLSTFFNWVNDYAFGHEQFNYTFITKKSFGKYNETSGFYDKNSCLYSMQMNETDAAMIYVKMPVIADGLRQTMPVLTETMQILSKYNVTGATKSQEILDNFRLAFDRYIWITLAFFVIAFVILIKVHVNLHNRRVKQRRMGRIVSKRPKSAPANLHRGLYNDPRLKVPNLRHQGPQKIIEAKESQKDKLTFLKDNVIYDVLTHLFQVETIEYDIIPMRIASIFLTLLSFWIFTYFGNLMSTDMVVEEEPSIIRSYLDLLEKKRIQMVFMEIHDDHKDFEYAPPGSVKHRLWQKSLKSVNGNREKMFVKIDDPGSLLNSGIGSVMTTVKSDKENRIELVAMFSSVVASTARATSCHLKAAFAYKNAKFNSYYAKVFKSVINIHSWISVDPDEKDHLATNIFRESFRTPLSKRIEQRMALFLESGMLKYSLHTAQTTTAISDYEITKPDEFDVYRKCMSDNFKDNMNRGELIALQPKQLFSLFYICFGIALLALSVLWYESWKGYNWRTFQLLIESPMIRKNVA